MTEEIRRFLKRLKLQKKETETKREMSSIFKTIKTTRSNTSTDTKLQNLKEHETKKLLD